MPSEKAIQTLPASLSTRFSLLLCSTFWVLQTLHILNREDLETRSNQVQSDGWRSTKEHGERWGCTAEDYLYFNYSHIFPWPSDPDEGTSEGPDCQGLACFHPFSLFNFSTCSIMSFGPLDWCWSTLSSDPSNHGIRFLRWSDLWFVFFFPVELD